MKKKYLFTFLPLIAALSSCGMQEAEQVISRYRIVKENGLPTVYNLGSGSHVTYLMMSRKGYLNLDGVETYGETVSEQYLENCIVWRTDEGGDLPSKDIVGKKGVDGVTFRGWYLYQENTFADELTKVPALNGSKVYAIFDGTSSGGGGGGGGGGGQTGETVIYTVINFPDWMPNDGAAVFAWAWGGDAGNGKWYTITLTADGTDHAFTNVRGTFDAPSNITGFNMARCSHGTTSPDWTVVGDNPGRIYNKTADVQVSYGTTTYSSPEWVEYSYNP